MEVGAERREAVRKKLVDWLVAWSLVITCPQLNDIFSLYMITDETLIARKAGYHARVSCLFLQRIGLL